MENKENKNLSLVACFSIACVWFGSHVGGGFATGNQTWQFYSSFGWIALITPFLSMGLLALVLRETIIFAQSNQTFSYDEFFKKLWNPYPKLSLTFEFFFIIILVVAVGVAIAGAASLFVDLGMSYFLAALMTGIILFFLTIFGTRVLALAATFMCLIIMAACLLIFGIGIAAQSAGLSHLMTGTELPFGTWPPLARVFIYSGFQAVVIPAIIACAKDVKTIKSANAITTFGFVMNGVCLALGVLLLLLWQGQSGLDLSKITLPNLAICNALGGGWLYWCYFITLFLAFISTGVSCIFGMVARLENKIFVNSTGIFSNIILRRALISLGVMCFSVGISMAGLTALVKYGYGFCGYLGIFAVIFPILIIGHIKNKRAGAFQSNIIRE